MHFLPLTLCLPYRKFSLSESVFNVLVAKERGLDGTNSSEIPKTVECCFLSCDTIIVVIDHWGSQRTVQIHHSLRRH